MVEDTPKGPGRPSLYTPELAVEICRRLAAGETLRAICRDDHMPDERTVRTWALENEEFSPQYDTARKIGYASWFDEIKDIADTPQQGVTVKESEKGTETRTGDMIEHRRLQIDARKWMLSKALPKIYGDKIETTANHKLVDENDKPLPPLELARKLAFLLTSGALAGEAPGAPAPTPEKH
jgi:hypothetical protein